LKCYGRSLQRISKQRLSLKLNPKYAISNQLNCGNRLQAILLIKCNKLELSNNEAISSLKVKLTNLHQKIQQKYMNNRQTSKINSELLIDTRC